MLDVSQAQFYKKNGFLVVNNILSEVECNFYNEATPG